VEEDRRALPAQPAQALLVAALDVVLCVVGGLGGEGDRDGGVVPLDAPLGERLPEPRDRALELDERAKGVDGDAV
jgi:hypothetical protein